MKALKARNTACEGTRPRLAQRERVGCVPTAQPIITCAVPCFCFHSHVAAGQEVNCSSNYPVPIYCFGFYEVTP